MGRSSYKKAKERFIGIPYRIANSETFALLGPRENKLLLDLLLQYNGRNNGRLSVCHTLMKKRNWAKSSLYRAYANLVHAGFVVVTRQGRKQRGWATLVAITWLGIDEPGETDYDEDIKPSPVPLGYWGKDKSSWKHQPNIKQQNNV